MHVDADVNVNYHFLHFKSAPCPGEVLPYMGYIGMCYIGMCGPKVYGFSAILVINRVLI